MAIYCNGSNEYLTIANQDINQLTIMGWIMKYRHHSGYENFYMSVGNNGWGVTWFITRPKNLMFTKPGVAGLEATGEVFSDLNTWYHFAVTLNSTTHDCYFYKNGVTYFNGAFNHTFNSAGGSYTIFSRGNASHFQGQMFDVRLYTDVKTGDEIDHIYNSQGNDGITTNLRGRWMMDEGPEGSTVTQAVDISGNGYSTTAVANSPDYYAAPFKTKRYT